ncbi:MAG: Rieske (2Fe-2S) protein [Alphaproteobacteria bacterium]|jgi:nitrite reductase/ring-hydroxylating ferredoxin subunit|nr:Rieske (2Fe-2S) protein [Alphaproteobacteria bacterium]MBT4084245.1 Rieske (2Fe-2S) protein [Alphaproteobacteria bacterium]MBT7748198.1 Rieske (2Fe-2S) protein [Alphaproteobacteria bacterium]
MTSQSNWIPVSGSSDLLPASARAVVLPDHDVVIWRERSGVVHAWENRCPHRGMRLSFGQVRDDRLVCRYHGWGFDDEGQCQSIPASPQMTAPPTACTKTWASNETAGLIWINITDEALDDTVPTDLNSEVPGTLIFCKSIFLDGELGDLITRMRTARFLPYGFEGNAQDLTWSNSDLSNNTIIISASGKVEDQIIIAGHQASEGRCGLHLLIQSDETEAEDRLRRLHYANWAKRLRWFLVNADLASDGFQVIV